MIHRRKLVLLVGSAAAMLAVTSVALAQGQGNGRGGGNRGNGVGNGGPNGGGGGGAPLPALGVTLLGQVIGAGGIYALWRRRKRRNDQA